METFLVTGAARGIGRALLAEGIARGHRMIAGVRHGEDALRLAAETGGLVRPLVFDVTDAASLAGAAASLEGPVDVLINNAGVIGPNRQSALDMDFDGFLRTLDVNALGPLRVVQAFLPHLRRSARPRILTITSQMGMMAYRKSDRVAYRASKSAVNKVMQALATDGRRGDRGATGPSRLGAHGHGRTGRRHRARRKCGWNHRPGHAIECRSHRHIC